MVGKVIGEQIRWLRIELRFSQKEIELRTGIHRPIISRIERGEYCQSLETVYRIAHALGVHPVLDILVVVDELLTELAAVDHRRGSAKQSA